MTALQQAVARQLGYDPKDIDDKDGELYGILSDVASHGADAGWSGFIYYRDTIAFTKANRKAIEALAREEADEFGQNVVEMITSFNCLDRSDPAQVEAVGRFVYGGHFQDSKKCDSETVYNALAWYALEETARALTDY